MRTSLLALALALLLAAPAAAGTYDVVACNAPGANGVNRSWSPIVEAFPPAVAQPEVYDFRAGCASGLAVSTHSPEQRRASYSATGGFRFSAPPGTAVVAIRATRYGEVRSSPNDPNTPDPEDGDWEVSLGADAARVGGDFGAAQCKTEGRGFCAVGTPGGSDTGLLRVAPAQTLTWSVGCGGSNLAYCFSNAGPGYGNYPLAILWLYGATVTLEDTSSPTAALDGELLAPGWRKPTASLSWSASDNAGIRAGQILLDGSERARVDSACDATRTVPCPNTATTPVAVGPISDGRHELKLVATDSAGNPTVVTRTLDIDGNGPTATVARASGKTITVSLTDGASGVASGNLEVRNRRDEPFQALPATLANGKLRATLDRSTASRAGIRITATDNAGNVTSGQMSEMLLRFAGRPLRSRAASLAYGRSPQITGTLRTRDGVPLAGQPIAVEQGLRLPAATVMTDARGRFSYRAPSGPSRRLRFVYAGGVDLAPLARAASLRVRASSTIDASRRVLRGRGRVRFSGRLGLRGATIPRSGKLVELQAYDRGSWRTFATARARGSQGRWSSSYMFAGTPGRYPVRLRIRREAVFPYDLGYSRFVIVRVR